MDWKQKADLIHRTLVGSKWPVYGEEDRRFVALALGGETGELLNLVKKEWRGDFGAHDPMYLEKVKGEMVDIRMYLEMLSHGFGIDLDAACEGKIPELLRRWPAAKKAIDEKLYGHDCQLMRCDSDSHK